MGHDTRHEAEPARELLILRHGKSAWDTGASEDFSRPLAARGRKQAPRMGKWLRRQALVPDAVLCSPARRARETALLVAEVLGLDPGKLRYDERLYLADAGALRALLAEVPPRTRRVLLCGHNPGLDALLEFLCAEPPPHDEAGKLLTTAALARLAMPADWSRLEAGCARLLALIRPRELKKSRSRSID